jgi:hypothetical protein
MSDLVKVENECSEAESNFHYLTHAQHYDNGQFVNPCAWNVDKLGCELRKEPKLHSKDRQQHAPQFNLAVTVWRVLLTILAVKFGFLAELAAKFIYIPGFQIPCSDNIVSCELNIRRAVFQLCL